jgi:hypothetical protein
MQLTCHAPLTSIMIEVYQIKGYMFLNFMIIFRIVFSYGDILNYYL